MTHGCGPQGFGRHGFGRHGFGPPAWGFPMGRNPQTWLAEMLGLEPQAERHRSPRPRVRRGDVRSAILDILRESDPEAINGYQIIQRITDRSDGAWRPSPGSVYPTIQQLEDEGLVELAEGPGRRDLVLTDAGREYVAERPGELADVWEPFDDHSERAPGGEYAEMAPEVGQLLSALWQLVTQGSERQRRDAIDILVDARRRLDGLLADEGRDDWSGDGEAE